MNLAEYKTLQKKTKAKKRFPEYEEQIRVVEWWYEMKTIKKIPAHYHLIYTDTSASRTPAQRGRYMRMGGRAGVLDLFIPVSRNIPNSMAQPSVTLLPNVYHALWVEMKAPDRVNEKDGGMSEEQVKFAADMAKSGNKWVLCHTAKSAIDEISKYLGVKI